MKCSILLALIGLIRLTTFSQNTEIYSIGEIHKIESKVLNETRILNIHLPLNFGKDSTYSVLYVLDGSAHEDFLHIVGLVQFFELQMGMPDFIVVGIENVDRKRDFTFHTDSESLRTNYPTSGHSAEFIQFLDIEMKPYIDKNFKTNGTNYLIGQLLGGLLASEILLKKPQMFSHYLIVSPSLWWDENSLSKQAAKLSENIQSPVYVSISVGAKEHRIMKRDARKLRNVMKKVKGSKVTFSFNYMKKENHATILHHAIYDALFKLYPFTGGNY